MMFNWLACFLRSWLKIRVLAHAHSTLKDITFERLTEVEKRITKLEQKANWCGNVNDIQCQKNREARKEQ